MKLKHALYLLPVIIAAAFIFKPNSEPETKKSIQIFENSAKSIGLEGNSQSRSEWENMRLMDPATGQIPSGMRRMELNFAKGLPTDADYSSASFKLIPQATWTNRGPWNVGGRTRAMAVDISNPDRLISCSVSGGIWESTNGGQTWTRVSPADMNFGASCIEQDQRNGKTDTWYIGTGEGYGTSASGGGAFYLGNGMYKSTDGGQTWNSLSSTSSGTPHNFDDYWDVIWDIALDNSDTINDVVFAATLGRVYRSADGGNTWVKVLGGSTYSYFTDVEVTTDGIAYATMSSDGSTDGIFRSVDGINWTNITPDSFPPVFDRVVIGINPVNENSVYFLAHTPGYGTKSVTFRGREEWNSLWHYRYVSGDGSDTNGVWTNLSQNIPNSGGPGDQFIVQGSYDMVMRVHPNDSNMVFIGGTNLYRSTDGFRTDTNTTHIGGYKPGTNIPWYEIVENHHPDQHGVFFHPTNPSVLFSNHDGGLSVTYDCFHDSISWTSISNGYVTSQFYTVAIDHATPNNDIIIGGLQDNGSHFTNSTNPQAYWPEPSLGDGSHCAVDDGHQYYYFSRQNGKMAKAQLDANGNVLAFRRIDPAGAKDYLFINPFILDPDDDEIMYLAGGKSIWRHDDLSQIVLDGSYDSLTSGWSQIMDSLSLFDIRITALTASKGNDKRLYFGTNRRKVYRIDGVDTVSHAIPTDITNTFFASSGYVSSIAVDPDDADKVMVVFSNYKVYSLFYSEDGGSTWTKVAGNLEGSSNGSGAGPSLRWAEIQKIGNKRVYWLATSIGVFATDTLTGTTTKWVQQGSQSIGNVVCDMIKVRQSDGLIVLATHGNGVFTTHVTDPSQVAGTKDNMDALAGIGMNVYPNPARENLNIEFSIGNSSDINITIYDMSGKQYFRRSWSKHPQGDHKLSLNASSLGMDRGAYFVVLSSKEKRVVKKLILL